MKTHFSKNKGFTLLETIIAVFIIAITFTSLFGLLARNTYSAVYAKNEITAMYLAQEAIDFVRNDRDTVAFQGGNWVNFLVHYGYPGTNSCFATDGCLINTSDWGFSTTVFPCPSSPSKCQTFEYENTPISEGYYTYTSSSTSKPTDFRRTVYMQLNGTNELGIKVVVEWKNGLTPKSKVLRASLLKWR